MRLATPAQSEWEGLGEPTAVIVAMGLALAVAGIVQTLETPVSQPIVAFELFISFLVPTGLATGGYWLASRDISANVRWRAATRVSIGIVVVRARRLANRLRYARGRNDPRSAVAGDGPRRGRRRNRLRHCRPRTAANRVHRSDV